MGFESGQNLEIKCSRNLYFQNESTRHRFQHICWKHDNNDLKKYNNRCATCGSIEGEPNIHYPNVTTQLQKGHKNPNKPLEYGNIIPQCDQCNIQDRNNFVYNNKGRVIKIANPRFVLRSDKATKKAMYDLLKRELEK